MCTERGMCSTACGECVHEVFNRRPRTGESDNEGDREYWIGVMINIMNKE